MKFKIDGSELIMNAREDDFISFGKLRVNGDIVFSASESQNIPSPEPYFEINEYIQKRSGNKSFDIRDMENSDIESTINYFDEDDNLEDTVHELKIFEIEV